MLLLRIACVAFLFLSAGLSAADPSRPAPSLAATLKEHMQPALRRAGFQLDDYWVWDGSVIQGEDGRYHLFASRWSKEVCFYPNFVTNSEVVRAVSDRPEGPYRYVETVIPRRGPEFWDGMMSHNPVIRRSGKKYLLFYTGTTYRFPFPDATNAVISNAQHAEARLNQQVGLMTADSLEGPWQRRDQPAIARNPDEGKWDSKMTTNASPCILPDGSILVIYKGVAHHGDFMRLGLVRAAAWDRPFARVQDRPLFEFDEMGASVEDPFFWHDGRQFHLLMKDMTGALCGEQHGGLYGTSQDAIHWDLRRNHVAYSRTITWDDGKVSTQGNLERPSLLFDRNGTPTHFFAATADVHFRNRQELKSTYILVIPLRSGP